MIVRVMNGSQYELEEGARIRLDQLDTDLSHAVAANDQEWFNKALAALLAEVTEQGTLLDESRIVPSDLFVPGPDASLDEVRALLANDAGN